MEVLRVPVIFVTDRNHRYFVPCDSCCRGPPGTSVYFMLILMVVTRPLLDLVIEWMIRKISCYYIHRFSFGFGLHVSCLDSHISIYLLYFVTLCIIKSHPRVPPDSERR